jgi:succinate dehydrogenase / fumarate reductase cytochrome b subunit
MTTTAITFYGSTVGKKVVMAVTGLIGFGFLVGHMVGNLLVFAGPAALNAYSNFLHGNLALLWGTRLVLTAAVILHIHCAFSLWGRNNEARPRSYYQRKDLATNYAALTMRYGGLVLLLFIVYHLLHLTWGVEQVSGQAFDPDNVYNNLVNGFSNPAIAGFYIVAQIALGMHLYHGIWSLTQSVGADHPKYNALRQRASIVGTLLVVLGFVVVPISVQTGVLQPVESEVGAVPNED